MVLPSLQSLLAKLSPEVRDTDHAPRFENLKSNLRTAYKMARDYARKSTTNVSMTGLQRNVNSQYVILCTCIIQQSRQECLPIFVVHGLDHAHNS